ncbi:MAG TPA: DNA repair protein RecO [Gammaproteobacteria bacterium]|jgi:DNA repair protein RecO (recombination protein O)|nr:DNA repair protein RecO [Gammaproteobacteria bacterium]
MNTRISLQPAYILHHRVYRETSLLLDVFTKDYGKISLVAKGVRQKKSPTRAILQPFMPLLISYQGRGELKNFVAADISQLSLSLQGNCLLAGFYLNELLNQVLQKEDPHSNLYAIYENTLLALQKGPLREEILRLFEKKLLVELGYGLQLKNDFLNGEKLVPENFYQFYPEGGFAKNPNNTGFSGKSLIALQDEMFQDKEILTEVKRLMRVVLASMLGITQIKSRELFK